MGDFVAVLIYTVWVAAYGGSVKYRLEYGDY